MLNVTFESTVFIDLRDLIYKVLILAPEKVDRDFVMYISVHDVLILGLLNERFEQSGVEVKREWRVVVVFFIDICELGGSLGGLRQKLGSLQRCGSGELGGLHLFVTLSTTVQQRTTGTGQSAAVGRTTE